MDGRERAAAARSTAAAVSRVSDAVEEVGSVVRGRVRLGLAVLGPAGTAPMGAVDRAHRLVHGAIRAAAPMVGQGVGHILERSAAPDARSMADDPGAAAARSALAAAFGDQLPAELVPPMSWRPAAGAASGTAVVVFIHGLGGHSGQWGAPYVAAATQAGFNAVFVDYNTGLPIAANGAALDTLLAGLVSGWPGQLHRMVIVAHSMGGLVTAAAFDHARGESAAAGAASGAARGEAFWPDLVTDVVTLGTPHEGAPLERFSDLALRAAALSPAAAPIAELGHHRSVGIKDLARGWPGALPDTVRHHAVAAHLGESPAGALAVLVGDGLVPQRSAAGRNPRGAAVRVHTLPATHHNALLDHPEVCDLLGRVLSSAAVTPANCGRIDGDGDAEGGPRGQGGALRDPGR